MPDHAHLLMRPAHDISLEKAMQYIKGGFSFRLRSKLDVWERSYDSRCTTDRHDYTTHTTYIHQNPVRANIATQPKLYPHSSSNPTHSSDPSPTHFA